MEKSDKYYYDLMNSRKEENEKYFKVLLDSLKVSGVTDSALMLFFKDACDAGYEGGFEDGYSEGYQDGKAEGYNDGLSEGEARYCDEEFSDE